MCIEHVTERTHYLFVHSSLHLHFALIYQKFIASTSKMAAPAMRTEGDLCRLRGQRVTRDERILPRAPTTVSLGCTRIFISSSLAGSVLLKKLSNPSRGCPSSRSVCHLFERELDLPGVPGSTWVDPGWTRVDPGSTQVDCRNTNGVFSTRNGSMLEPNGNG